MKIRKLLQEPYIILIVVSALMLTISLFAKGNTEIYLHDTYFIVERSIPYFLFSVILLLTWLAYALMNRLLPSLVLTRVNIYSISLLSLIYFIINFSDWMQLNKTNKSISYVDYSSISNYIILVLAMIISLIIIWILSFIINIAIGTIRLIKGGN